MITAYTNEQLKKYHEDFSRIAKTSRSGVATWVAKVAGHPTQYYQQGCHNGIRGSSSLMNILATMLWWGMGKDIHQQWLIDALLINPTSPFHELYQDGHCLLHSDKDGQCWAVEFSNDAPFAKMYFFLIASRRANEDVEWTKLFKWCLNEFPDIHIGALLSILENYVGGHNFDRLKTIAFKNTPYSGFHSYIQASFSPRFVLGKPNRGFLGTVETATNRYDCTLSNQVWASPEWKEGVAKLLEKLCKKEAFKKSFFLTDEEVFNCLSSGGSNGYVVGIDKLKEVCDQLVHMATEAAAKGKW